MNSLLFLGLFASCHAAPQLLAVAKPYINSGAAAGPLTAAFGDLVSTGRGLRPISLEGFSEDVNQDGFVDPIGQAVAAPLVAAATPLVYTAAVAAPAAVAETKTTAVAPAAALPLTYAAAPLVQYAAAPALYHTVQTIPQVTVQRQILTHTTHHVINHAPIIAGFPLVAAAPAAAAPAAAAEPAAAATEPAAAVESA